MLVLDTDHLTFLERGRGAEASRLLERLEAASHEMSCTTIITYEEQTRGWLAYIRQARTPEREVEAYRRLLRHLDVYRAIPVLPYNAPAAAEYRSLLGLRLGVGAMDLKIAAIALAWDATLLSRNLAHFRKVPGLRVEDWTV